MGKSSYFPGYEYTISRTFKSFFQNQCVTPVSKVPVIQYDIAQTESLYCWFPNQEI